MMTIEEIQVRKECQTFDCKSIQIDPKSLAVPIVAMANADGSVLAIGVSDKTRRIEGLDGNKGRHENTTHNTVYTTCLNSKSLSWV